MKSKNKIGFEKKAILTGFLSILAVAALYLYSCDFLSSEDDFDYMLDLPEEFNEVGKLHNEGLDFVFNAIKMNQIERLHEKENSLKSAEKVNFYNIAQKATHDFCRKKGILNKYSFEDESLIKTLLHLKSAEQDSYVTDHNSKQQQILSQEIITSMEGNKSKSNIEKLKRDLENINQKTKELPKLEAEAIFYATSTAYATYQYWHKNIRKWYFALNYPAILDEYKEEDLNHLQVKNGELRLKSSDEENSWFGSIWNSVEDWWTDSWNDEEKNEWFDETLEEMAKSDVKGALLGGNKRSIPGATSLGMFTSAIKGIDQLIDHYESYKDQKE